MRTTIPRGDRPPVTQSYTALSQVIKESGLLRRTPWFYGLLMGALTLALGGAVTGFVLLGDSWYQLLIAGALGIIFRSSRSSRTRRRTARCSPPARRTTASDAWSRRRSSASATSGG